MKKQLLIGILVFASMTCLGQERKVELEKKCKTSEWANFRVTEDKESYFLHSECNPVYCVVKNGARGLLHPDINMLEVGLKKQLIKPVFSGYSAFKGDVYDVMEIFDEFTSKDKCKVIYYWGPTSDRKGRRSNYINELKKYAADHNLRYEENKTMYDYIRRP
jgi:hypothetical protein